MVTPRIFEGRSMLGGTGGRRAFLVDGALVLAATATFDARRLLAADEKRLVRFGVVTDLHFADKPAAGTRHYRRTPEKLAEAAARFENEEPSFVVELGDLIDAAESVETEKKWLRTIDRQFAAIAKDRHYVLGNHCVHTLTKPEFLEGIEREQSYHSFDRGGVHFVVLDSCFRGDGVPYGRGNFKWTDPNVPAAELEWLDGDLKAADGPAVVFAHQRLDVANSHGVRNAPAVRRVLERSGKVRAVLQGHSHRNDLKEIAGIPYCTLVAMVEGADAADNGYSIVDVQEDGTMRLTGFRKQEDHQWTVD